MRSWLTYIILLMGACAAVLTSCSNVLAEEEIDTCIDRTTVSLNINYGGNHGAVSRDVSDENKTLDYTTEGQASLDINDVFVLIFEVGEDQSMTLLDWLRNLEFVDDGDGYYYTRKIKGIMPQYSADTNVRFAVLTNLIQNKIKVGDNELDSHADVINFLTSMKGETSSEIYSQLIYNYDAKEHEVWNIGSRRIPMYGISPSTLLNKAELDMGCSLYRAVAKVQIWVDGRNGIAGSNSNSIDDDFIIKRIVVKNANAQGYCVSSKTLYSDIYIQYNEADVPNGVLKQSEDIIYTPNDNYISYEIDGGTTATYNDAREAYLDYIYLPEQKNSEDGNVYLEVHYRFNGNAYGSLAVNFDDEKYEDPGVIKFKEGEEYFDIIRNHSYIFNISSVAKEVDAKLIYEVQDYYVDAKVEIPFK